MTRKKKVLVNILLTLFFVAAVLVQSPNLNPLYPDGAFGWCFMISCYIALNFLLALGGVSIKQDSVGRSHLSLDKSVKGVKGGLILLAVIWVLYFLVNLLSSPIVNYSAYRDQLGTPVEAEFTETVQPIALDQLPIVDKELASELADKKIGENPSLGSQVVKGEPVIQQVNGNLMWVIPLEHSGFFKWLKNINGSAGYITVSATSVKDVKLVQDYKIKYQAGAYFFSDLARHTRFFGGGLFEGMTDYSFELDDSGKPYWVISLYKNKWLFSLPEATGVLTVNASTGETTKYDTASVPEWIDRVQPEDLIMQQIDNQGKYVHGIFNFSNQDKFRASEGHIIVYNEGNCYLFTGLTSVGSDQSATGFMMIDMVTKEVKRYQISGATEGAAQTSAQGKVQQYGYTASFPMIINLDGQPTYFMTLKDNARLIKQYAFVSVSDYTSVGTGETISTAMRNFRQVYRGSGNTIQAGTEKESIEGTVLRISSESIGDTLTYKVILESKQNLIFTVAYDLSNELGLTREGDRIAIDYQFNDTGVCTASTFDNLEFTQVPVEGESTSTDDPVSTEQSTQTPEENTEVTPVTE